MGEGNQDRPRTRRGKKNSVIVPKGEGDLGDLTMKEARRRAASVIVDKPAEVTEEGVVEVPFSSSARKDLFDLGLNKEKIEKDLELMRSVLEERIRQEKKDAETSEETRVDTDPNPETWTNDDQKKLKKNQKTIERVNENITAGFFALGKIKIGNKETQSEVVEEIKKMIERKKQIRDQEIESLNLLLAKREKIKNAEATALGGEKVERKPEAETSDNSLELSDINKKKLSYLEEELERQKKLLEFEKSKNSLDEIKRTIENHIKLTEQTIANLKNTVKGGQKKETPKQKPTIEPRENPFDLSDSYVDNSQIDLPPPPTGPTPPPAPVMPPLAPKAPQSVPEIKTGTHTTPEGVRETYDSSGIINTKNFPDGTLETYDSSGIIQTKDFPDGSRETYNYVGKLLTRYDSTGKETHRYDINGNEIPAYVFAPISPLETVPKIVEETKTSAYKRQTPKINLLKHSPEKEERKFDTGAAVKKINMQIAEEETAKGTPFTPEEKKTRVLELFLEDKEEFNKKTIESANFLKRSFVKTEKWWEHLEDTPKGKALKVAMSAAFIGSSTIVGASLIGVPPSLLGAAKKLTIRIAGATGLNMAMTSGFPGKVLAKFKGNNAEEKKGIKKYLTLGNTAMVGGLGLSFILSGGTVAGIAAGGIAVRKLSALYLDKKIKEGQKEINIKNLSGSLGNQLNYNPESFAEHLDQIGKDYENMVKNIKQLKRIKGLINSAATIGVGIATIHVMEHKALVEHDHKQTELEAKEKIEQQKHWDNLRKNEQAEQKDELKNIHATPSAPVPETPAVAPVENIKINPDTIVHKGQGIEHAFIKQIEHNKELAKELKWDGKEDLHHFAQREAHVLAIKEGYVDKTGHEIRVSEADKMAYEIKMENGHPVVDETTTDRIKIETHHKGDAYKFDETDKKHEYEYTKTHPVETTTIATHNAEQTQIPEQQPRHGIAPEPEHVSKPMTAEEAREVVVKKMDIVKPEPEIITSKSDVVINPKFIGTNPFHLTNEKLTEAFEASQKNISFLFEKEPYLWENLKNIKASTLLGYNPTEYNDLVDSSPMIARLVDYVRLLKNSSGVKPSGLLGLGKKSAEEYISEALQNLEAGKGKISLDEFETILRK